MSSTAFLVTGGGGQLARDLAARLPASHAPDRRELSITDLAAVRSALARTGARTVFNCAAFNGVDQAESAAQEAFAVNAQGAANVARACREAGAKLVHYSTNFVFDGISAEPYSELDVPEPTSVYGRSKREGEMRVLDELPEALVIRSAGLFGHQGSAIKGGSFPDRIVARAREGQPLRVVDDQFLNPTYTGHLATASIGALEAGVTGVVHLVAEGCCSFHEFATEVLAIAGILASIARVKTESAAGIADRPRNGCLRSVRRPALPSWQEGLAAFWASRPSG